MTVIHTPKAGEGTTAPPSPPVGLPAEAETQPTEVLFPEAKRRERHRRLAVALVVLLVAAAGVTTWSLSNNHNGSSSVTKQMTPAEFLALAKSGSDGTFEAIYHVSGGPSGSGTVVVAQRAAVRSTAWPDRAGSAWSYRFIATNGAGAQWIEQGTTARDCWRKTGATAWTCSGPGSYEASNGFDIATLAFIPGTVLQEIRDVVDDSGLPYGDRQRIRTYSMTNRVFGMLSCLHVTGSGVVPTGPTTFCLDSRGVLVSVKGTAGGLLDWPTVKLLSRSTTAPASDFVPLAKSSTPHGRFELPPE